MNVPEFVKRLFGRVIRHAEIDQETPCCDRREIEEQRRRQDEVRNRLDALAEETDLFTRHRSED